MAGFPVHPFHINGFISKVRAKTHQQQDISAELELIIEGAKATLHEINEQCEDDICRTAAEYATDAETAFSALMLALNHYPGGQFAEVMVIAYRLSEGYFQEINRQLDAIDVLAGKIHAAAAAITWNTAVRGHKNKIVTRQGGLESRGTPEERQEMYEACQEEIDRLCLEKGHSYLQACKIAAKNIRKIYPDYLKETIHHDTIRKNTRNPY